QPDRERIISEIHTDGIYVILRRSEDLVRDCERAVKASELIGGDSQRSKRALIRAYHIAGRNSDAIRECLALLRQMPKYCTPGNDYGYLILEQYGWLRRAEGNEGEIKQALQLLDRWLFREGNEIRGNEVRSAHCLLIERARLLSSLQRWDDAEKDL